MSKKSNVKGPVNAPKQKAAPTPAPESSVPYNITSKIKVSPYYLSFISSYDEKYVDCMSYNGEGVCEQKSAQKAPAKKDPKAKKAKKVYAKGAVVKRPLIIAVICILMLAVLAVGALGFVSIDAVNDYVGIFEVGGENVYYHDPIFGGLEAWAADFIDPLGDSIYYDSYLSTIETENIAVTISLYVLPIALVLIALFALFMVLKSLVALFGGKERKLGFMPLITTIFGLFVAGCGIIWNGMGIGEIMSVILGDGAVVSAVYGLYGLIALPLLASILSMFAYKKIK